LKKLIRIFIINGLLFGTLGAYAQDFEMAIEMADSMRESGKIYVVVAVLSIIFLGLSIFLFTLDRRLREIEKKQN